MTEPKKASTDQGQLAGIPEKVKVEPPPKMHQRDVSALTNFDEEDAPPPPKRHMRGISVDLTRRLFMPQKEPEPLQPWVPPRARDVRASTADGRASTAVKQSTWGAASKLDSKVVGLGTAARYSANHHRDHGKDLSASKSSRHKRASAIDLMKTIVDEEDEARDKALTNPFKILIIGGIAAAKVFGGEYRCTKERIEERSVSCTRIHSTCARNIYFLTSMYCCSSPLISKVYLITLDTLLSISLAIGLTCYWYFTYVRRIYHAVFISDVYSTQSLTGFIFLINHFWINIILTGWVRREQLEWRWHGLGAPWFRCRDAPLNGHRDRIPSA